MPRSRAKFPTEPWVSAISNFRNAPSAGSQEAAIDCLVKNSAIRILQSAILLPPFRLAEHQLGRGGDGGEGDAAGVGPQIFQRVEIAF